MAPDNTCPRCNGKGTLALHGIALTSDDLLDWTEDEMESYKSGAYDTTCEMCGGKGTATDDDVSYYAEQAAELRYGA